MEAVINKMCLEDVIDNMYLEAVINKMCLDDVITSEYIEHILKLRYKRTLSANEIIKYNMIVNFL